MEASKMVAVVSAALVIGAIAVLSYVTQTPWLVPSLGSALFTQLFDSETPGATPYGTAVGQVIGGAAGFAGLFLAGAASAPLLMSGHAVDGARVLAVCVAVPLAVAGQLAAKATSAAGGATAIIVAVGAERASGSGVVHLLVGIALVTVLGEAARQAVLRARR